MLDGLPLALVLAAGLLDTLTIERIAEGLAQRGRLPTGTGAQTASATTHCEHRWTGATRC